MEDWDMRHCSLGPSRLDARTELLTPAAQDVHEIPGRKPRPTTQCDKHNLPLTYLFEFCLYYDFIRPGSVV